MDVSRPRAYRANAAFSSSENDCARFRGHSPYLHQQEENLLLLGSLLLAAFLLC
jgi:hypothetical protein